MATITQQTTAVTGNTLTAAIWNEEFANIINAINGGLDNANIANAAGIAYSKLDLEGAVQASDLNFTPATLTGTEELTNKTLVKPTMKAAVHPMTVNLDGATVTFSMAESNHHIVTLGGNRTLAVSNDSNGQAFIIHLLQDGTGSRTVTWWSGIKWAGGDAPTLTTTASKIDTFGFIKRDTAEYLGYIIGKNI